MEKKSSIVDRLGLNQISQKTADRLLEVLYRVEDEQGYENKEVSAAINYLQEKDDGKQKPIVYFESRHESGNIFALLGKVNSAIQDNDAFNELWAKIQQGSYDQAIKLIKEKVTLIDLDGIY